MSGSHSLSNMPKRKIIYRNEAVKTAALTLMKSGRRAKSVSKNLNIPTSTLSDWKAAAKADGTWGPDGDNNNAAGDGLAKPALEATTGF